MRPLDLFIAVRNAGRCTLEELSQTVFHRGFVQLGPSNALHFLSELEDLQHAGLLIAEDSTGTVDLDCNAFFARYARNRTITVTLSVATTWAGMQEALGISLTEIAKLTPDTMVAAPYFGPPTIRNDVPDVFMFMTFHPRLKPVYDDHMTKVVRAKGLSIKRADDFFTTHNVISDIWTAINGARIIIADCTGRNPNVFYEIGMAHVVGKPVVLITQSSDDIPFDLRQIRYLHYEYTPRGMAVFEGQLSSTISEALG